jgi:hypothetical protein
MAAHHCRLAADICENLCSLVADAVDAAASYGKVIIYTGSEPATADAAAATEVATCIAAADPSFGAAEWVVGTGCWESANLDDFVCAAATGNAGAVTHFRLTDSDDVVVLQGTCSATAGDDLVLTGAVIVHDAEVIVTELVIAVPLNQA